MVIWVLLGQWFLIRVPDPRQSSFLQAEQELCCGFCRRTRKDGFVMEKGLEYTQSGLDGLQSC